MQKICAVALFCCLMVPCKGITGRTGQSALTRDASGWVTNGLPYVAHIDNSGRLDSLKVDGFDYITNVEGQRKGLYLIDGRNDVIFNSIKTDGDTLKATGPKAKVRMQFLPSGIKITVQNLAIDHGHCFRMNVAENIARMKSMSKALEYKLPLKQNVYSAIRLIGPNQSSISFGKTKSYHLNSGCLVSPMKGYYMVRFPWIPKGVISIIDIPISTEANLEDGVSVSVSGEKKDFTFWDDKEHYLTTTMTNPDRKRDFHADIVLRIRSYLTKEVAQQLKKSVKLKPGEKTTLTWKLSNLEPMLYLGEIWVVRDGKEGLCCSPRFVYNASKLAPPEEPEDFESFWRQTLAEQAKIPVDLKIEKMPDKGKHEVFHFSFAGLLGYRCYGWLTIPKEKRKKYPAVLVLPPAGNRSQPIPLYSGKVGMRININTFDVNLKEYDVATWPAQYLVTGILDKEKYCLRFGYAAIVRAAEILAARPEVDQKHLSVQGSSQGGGLTFIAAGLYPHFETAKSIKPGLCRLDWNLDYLQPPYFPIAVNGYIRNDIEDTLKYYLPSHFARRIKCPFSLSFGLYDDVTPCVGVFCAYNAIPGKKSIKVDAYGSH